jgi:uroporphyrinogen-III synthase
VLFPQAKESLQSIQQQFVKRENVINLVVYETLKRNEGKMPDSKIIVFTSPSNVEAWFENYSFPSGLKAVAMGDATANALRKRKVFPAALADSFDDAGIARAVFSASAAE